MFLKNYKIEKKEILRKWTTDLLSDEQLLSLEQGEQLKDFITSVFGICSEPHDMKQALIMDILIEKFKQTKRGQQHFKTVQRQRLLHLVIALIDSEDGDRHTSHDLLQVVLEHFFQLKEEEEISDIAQIVCRYAELAAPQDAWEIYLPLVLKQPKVQAQQIQILLTLMKAEKDLDKIREIDNSLSEYLMSCLASENFNSTLTYSNILALSTFFVLKAQKLDDIGSVAALYNNQEISSYLLSQSIASGFVNSQKFLESKKAGLADAQN